MKTFRDRVAVITGGASGMGRGSALALAKRGVRIVIADLNEARMAETVGELEALGVQAIAVRCDVSRAEDIEALARAARERFGGVNILMNNAGVLPVGAIEDTPLEAWRRVLDVNLLSVVIGVRTFLPDLLAADEAHIVNTASLAGLISYDIRTVAYNVSKAGVVSLSEALALALWPRGVGVTCLCPGPVQTNIREQVSAFGAPAPHLGAYASMNFASRTAEDVGELVASAVETNRFLLPTNEVVTPVLARRGADYEGFLKEVDQFLRGLENPSAP